MNPREKGIIKTNSWFPMNYYSKVFCPTQGIFEVHKNPPGGIANLLLLLKDGG
jgi:hypothetical protein